MQLDNWFTQGVIVNITTAVAAPVSIALWTFLKRIRDARKLHAPTTTLARSKGMAWTNFWDIVFIAVNITAFAMLPEVTSRWSALLLAMPVLGVAAGLFTLSFRFIAMHVENSHIKRAANASEKTD